MSISPAAAAATFNRVERDYVRQQLDVFFSTLPTVAEGIQLRPRKMARGRARQRCGRPHKA
jgi:hypothetical protein